MASWKEENLLRRVRENKKVVAKDKEHLERLIKERIRKFGLNCDLNDIDVSQVTDMSWLFCGSSFNGDISEWDVSNVKYMENMFRLSEFDGDISKWNVSKVWNMEGMFAFSYFNGDISKWDVSNVYDMRRMFAYSEFNGDISEWRVYAHKESMFEGSPLEENEPEWYRR